MQKRKLERMPYAQAHVEIDCYGSITLVSYETDVINIDPQGWLTCSGTYSQTTRKHISAFMREYAPNYTYKDAKAAFERNFTFNVYTGEVQYLGGE